jgi:hypothetical protein
MILGAWWRPAAALCVVWAMLATGCGPGVGGTGTGGDAASPTAGFLAPFGASAALVCAADFADRLDCPAASGATPAPQGSARTSWADDPLAARAEATLDGNGVDFAARCEGLSFSGTWGQLPGASAGQYFGAVVAAPATAPTPATLVVQPAPDAALSMRLLDVQGRVLFGPRTLVRVEGPPTPASCP